MKTKAQNSQSIHQREINMIGLLSYIKNNTIQKPMDITDWKEFHITDLFDCQLAKGDLQPKKLKQGEVPLVSAGFANNGIVAHIDEHGDGISELFCAGALTVDMFGKAFYQPTNFFAVSHGRVNILIPKFKLTKNMSLFIVCILNKTFEEKYSFSKMCSNSKLVKETICLPVTKKGDPDWQYMDKFIEKIYKYAQTQLL